MAKYPKHDPKTVATGKKGFNWKRFLIEAGIAIVIFDVIAWIVAYYFILPSLKR